jgi:H+/gluconate symporter-like permease
MLIYIRQWQNKFKPQPNANPIAVVFGWLLFGVMLLVGLAIGLLFLMIGWILLLPVMWTRRRQLKQMWQFSKATKQAQQQARQRAERDQAYRENQNDSTIIEAEYEVKDDR